MNEKLILTHEWQEQGLGVAPFDAVCILSLPDAEEAGYMEKMQQVSADARSFGVRLGSCYSCGMGITNNVVIRDANKKHFVVGCDCAEKTSDSQLTTKTAKLEKDRLKKVRDAKREAARLERERRIAADLTAQRERNGGKTDAEVAADERKANAESIREKMVAANGWLIQILERNENSDFCRSIAQDLARVEMFDKVRGRVHDVCREVYGKEVGGRKGTDKYRKACVEFDAKFEATIQGK